jgi:glutamate racemase
LSKPAERVGSRAGAEGAERRRRLIGIFDSGVGGLSVLREIRRELPHENVVYAADSGNAPYGGKPAEFIQQRANAIVGFLEEQGAKAIVVACNTATGVAVDALRARWKLPIIGIEPAIKPAAASTASGVVGVLATSQTIASARFARLIDTFAGTARIIAQACPGLVEQVERGDLAGDETRKLLVTCLRPVLAQGADTLVLGCTHYPFLEPAIAQIAGPGVRIINPAAAVARQLRRRLEQQDLHTDASGPGQTTFWTSGAPEQLQRVISALGFEAAGIRPLPL